MKKLEIGTGGLIYEIIFLQQETLDTCQVIDVFVFSIQSENIVFMSKTKQCIMRSLTWN